MSDPLILVRAVHLLAAILVAGVVFFQAFVAEPALRGGCIAVLTRLRAGSFWLIALGLAIALASGAAWLGLLAARVGEGSSLAALEDAASTLLRETQFGAAWQLRLVLALVLAVGLWRKQAGDPARLRQGVAIVASVMFVGTLAWSGHGAATPGNSGYLHVVADVLHLIAAAIWLGGLVPLVMLLRCMIPTIDDGGSAALLDGLRRYSNLGLFAVALLVLSGAINAVFVIDRAEMFVASDYGRVLSAKLALFAGMVTFAAINRLRFTPALALAGDDSQLAVQAARRIHANALAEIGLGVAIVVLVAWLGVMVPGVAADAHMH